MTRPEASAHGRRLRAVRGGRHRQVTHVPAKVHAEGTGTAEFTWDGEQEIVLTRVGGPDIDVNVISAGFKDPEKLTTDPAYRFRWAFDLLKAYEDQPGTFEIS